MMEDVIAGYLMGLRGGKSVDAFVRDIVAADEDADGLDPVDTSKAPGLDRLGNLTHTLCAHYNPDYAAFIVLPYAERYRLGWPVLEEPSDEISDGLTRALAPRLVSDGSDTPLDFASGGCSGGADDDGDSGDNDAPPDKQAKRKGKSGRKTRTNTSKKEETDMNRMIERSINNAEQNEVRRAAREDAAAIRSEKKAEDRYQRERDERELDRKHERDMRPDERREEREDRDKREAAKAARRAEEKADKERDQKFELEIMRLKVQMAVAQRKKP